MTKNMTMLFQVWRFIVAPSFLCSLIYARIPIGERHSYSLTTFDTDGKLGQVDWACQAAAMGAPLVAVVVVDDKDDNGAGTTGNHMKRENCGILMASLQRLPSMLMEDDGTSRFARISSEIVVAHSGLSADGRVVVAAAQRLAIQHEYTFDEEIPIGVFLQELSLFFQEHTMKPATRPFGVILMIAYVPKIRLSTANQNHKTQLFRLDPSGSISGLGSSAIINGKDLNNHELEQLFQRTTKESESDEEKFVDDSNQVPSHKRIASFLRHALQRQTQMQGQEKTLDNETIVSAVLSQSVGFSVRRHPMVSHPQHAEDAIR